jgi:ABC-type glycerol-3-phosphate transport system permease component
MAEGSLASPSVREGVSSAPRTRKRARTRVLYAALIFIGLLSNLPFIWMALSALKPVEELLLLPVRWLPRNPTFHNYAVVLEQRDFLQAFANSLIATIGTVLLCQLLAIPAAYGFARFQFPGRAKLMYMLLFVQFFPVIVFVVPLYILFSRVGWVDTIQGLITAHAVYVLPLSVWMLTSAFRSFPREVEEAAEVDGAGTLDILLRVLLPVSLPAIAATVAYAWIQAWQEYLVSATLSTSLQSRLLPVQIAFFMSTESTDWSVLMAASVIVTLPVLILFPFLSRYFTTGLSAGAIKG